MNVKSTTSVTSSTTHPTTSTRTVKIVNRKKKKKSNFNSSIDLSLLKHNYFVITQLTAPTR